jgi:hypothetical protein
LEVFFDHGISAETRFLSKNNNMARPTFKPTAPMRKRVAESAGAGMSHEEIAIGLQIARGTLEKHFERELSVGAYAKRMDTIQAMFKTAKAGNVAAQKAYLALTPRASAPPLPKAPRKGKKEQANDDAQVAQKGTDWDNLLPGSRSVQ